MRHVLHLFLLLAVSACGGTAPVATEPALPPPPSGPAFTVVLAGDGELVRYNLREQGRSLLGPLSGTVVETWQDPAGASTLVAAADDDSTRLYRIGPGGLEAVHTAPAGAVYTASFAPDGGAFAFGHYRPIRRDGRPAMGAGDILLARDGAVTRVGCSASKAVMAWLPDDGLLVRNTNNIYVVDREGCATRATVDARRMLQPTASPTGAHLVYVHRELVYNRARRAYEADSTFMISGVDGADARTVVNFRYDPDRFAWRADGSELAYDVAVPDMQGRRAISIFDAAAGTSAYLHPPAAGSESEWDAHWAPDGGAILYRRGDAGDHSLAVRSFSERFPTPVPDSEGAEPIGWMDARRAVYRDTAGGLHLFDLTSGAVVDLPADGAWIQGTRLD